MSILDVNIAAILICIIVFLFVLGGHYIIQREAKRQKLENRIMMMIGEGGPLHLQQSGGKQIIQARRENILQKRLRLYFQENNFHRFSFQDFLYRAGITMSVYHVICILAASVLILDFVIGFFTDLAPMKVFMWSFLGVGGGFFFLTSSLREKHSRKLLLLLPEAMDIMIRGLRVGFSVEKTFVTVAAEVPAPVGNEFRLMCEHISFGMSFEDAIRNTSRRLQNPDFDFFVIALVIQRDTGGSLAEMMSNIVGVLRKREELRLKVRALSSEARTTGWIVGSLPFLATGFMTWMNPGYLREFLIDPVGEILIYIVLGLIGSTILVVNYLMKFEI